MDDHATRSANATRLRELVSRLEVDGGDAVTVLLGEADRLVTGVDRYGPLDLDAPHDWQAEEDEERADILNYQAIRRMVARRGTLTRSAARREVAAIDQGGILDPTWTGEGPRLARERQERKREAK